MVQIHPIPPLFDECSRVLILGSFPSVKSREQAFFYGHQQNRFWRVLPALFGEPPPQSIAEKKTLALRHGVALWDVIARCDIKGSADSSIRAVQANDLNTILRHGGIRQIFVNGKTAEKYYKHLIEPKIGRTAICLPSTSPANAAWSEEKLIAAWSVIKDYL